MASIVGSPNGYRRIQFYDVNKERQTIPLGKCSKSLAESIKKRVESLLVAKILGGDIDQDDAVWLAGKGQHIRPQFARVGLIPGEQPVEPVVKQGLAEFLDQYVLANTAGKKPATLIVWRQAIRVLKEHMPTGIALADVTKGHAKAFQDKLKSSGLAATTVHKRIVFARQFFQYAVDWKVIDENPFADLKNRRPKTSSNVEVPRESINLILAKCNSTWKGIVGLSRFGGLRCPSETLSLKWGDIDWELGRMSIPEPKVEHHDGRGVRSCPLFPELREILETLFDEATIDGKYPSADSYVIDKPAYREAAMKPGGWANANLRTQFLKILRRAGVSPWARLFHSMRASRQTELEAQFPLHVVCSWLGNSESVAKDSYLLVTDSHFQSAIKSNPCATGVLSDEKTGNPCATGVLQTAEAGGNNSQETSENTGENEKSQVSLAHSSGGGGTRTPMENTGKNVDGNGRGTPAVRLGPMSTNVAHASKGLKDLIEWWPSLSLESQNRIHELAKAELITPHTRSGLTLPADPR